MKQALLIFAFIGSFSVVTASAAHAEQICGEVFVGQCDVDYCLTGFLATDAAGVQQRYGLNSDDGGRVKEWAADHVVAPMEGQTYCADTSDVDFTGAIDLSKLVLKSK